MESAFAKLSRAKVHWDQLDTEVKAFRDRDPFDFPHTVSDHMFDESLAVIIFRVQVKEEMPSHWGLIVGDILTNLRAALDHVIFGHAAARAEAGGSPLTARQEKELNFPIISVAGDWPNRQARLTPFVDPAVLAVIERWQPFNQLHQVAPDWEPLALLNSLVNRDKHREVRVVSYVNEEFNVIESNHEVVARTAPPKAMTDGAVVATMRIRRPVRLPDKRVRYSLGTFSVQNGYVENIDLPKVGAQRSVLSIMGALVSNVEELLQELQAAGA
jgi:hypothetical protein